MFHLLQQTRFPFLIMSHRCSQYDWARVTFQLISHHPGFNEGRRSSGLYASHRKEIAPTSFRFRIFSMHFIIDHHDHHQDGQEGPRKRAVNQVGGCCVDQLCIAMTFASQSLASSSSRIYLTPRKIWLLFVEVAPRYPVPRSAKRLTALPSLFLR